jgi:phage tail protein X
VSYVSLTSRYQPNVVGTVLSPDGIPRQAILQSYPQPLLLQVFEHLWTRYDRVDLLAARYYGNETSWWMIARANPTILDWINVPIGSIIRIPNVS